MIGWYYHSFGSSFVNKSINFVTFNLQLLHWHANIADGKCGMNMVSLFLKISLHTEICSDFANIFDVDWFISYLSKDVPVVKRIPDRVMRSMEKLPWTMRPPRKSMPEYYLEQVLPILRRRHVSIFYIGTLSMLLGIESIAIDNHTTFNWCTLLIIVPFFIQWPFLSLCLNCNVLLLLGLFFCYTFSVKLLAMPCSNFGPHFIFQIFSSCHLDKELPLIISKLLSIFFFP